MTVLTDFQAKDQAQKVSSLIEQLQHAQDAANVAEPAATAPHCAHRE